MLRLLAEICEDGSYKIIEKTELAKEINSRAADFNALDQMVRFLKDSEMVDVKYTDETVFCLTLLPKGRVAVESMRPKSREIIRIDKKTLLILFGGCFLASVIGSIVGALIAGLF